MNGEREQLGILDALAVVSFLIGVANYGENVDQRTMGRTVQAAVNDIHQHLYVQDKKIDRLLELLEGGQHER